MRYLLLIVLMLTFVCSTLAVADTINVSPDNEAIKAAIYNAAPGDTIAIATGTCEITSTVVVNKAVTITGTDSATCLTTHGAGFPMFSLMAPGATLENLEIYKTDKTGVHNLIYIGASNVTVRNNVIHGNYILGDAEVSRAMEMTGGLSGLLIANNTIYNLRQPAYINGSLASPTTGSIVGNNVFSTRGWVLDGPNMTFSGNVWGTGSQANAVDIAILSGTSSTYYTNLAEIIANNNHARIDDQRTPGRVKYLGVAPGMLATVDAELATNPFAIDPDTKAPDVAADAPFGWGSSSFFASVNNTGATAVERYRTLRFSPATLFGSPVTIGQIKSMSYQSKTNNANVDWRFSIYTMPQGDGLDVRSWYRNRIQSHPIGSLNINATVGQWNQWSTALGNNQLQWGTPGTVGNGLRPGFAAENMTWSQITNGPVTGTGGNIWDFSVETVKFIDVIMGANSGGGTGAASFDALCIELTNGQTAVIDLTNDGTLTLTADPASIYVQPNETVTVTLAQSGLPVGVSGYQAFLSYDAAKLSVASSILTSTPYGLVLSNNYAIPSAIDLAAGIQYGTTPGFTTIDADLATLMFTVAANAADGETTIGFRTNNPPTRFTDVNGNAVAPATVNATVVIDNTDPVITCPGNIEQSNDPGKCGAAINPGTATATDINGSGVESVTGVRSDGLALNADYPVATTTIIWTAVDKAGNTATCTQTIKVNDTEKPTVTAGAISTCYPTVLAAEAAALAATSALDNCTSVTELVKTVSTTGTCSATVTVRVTDIAGNWSEVSYGTRVDNSAPEITCPTGVITLYAEADSSSAAYGWTATAIDNCDGSVAVTCTHTSGSRFTGETVVTCTAVDSCGNIATKSFTVKVLPYNEASIEVQLKGVVAGATRCIQFTFGGDGGSGTTNAPVVISAPVTVDAQGKGTASINAIPAGYKWTCISAKDVYHALRSTVALSVEGGKYVAHLVDRNTVPEGQAGWNAADDDSLIGGDLTNDNWIDILDFGVFSGKANANNTVVPTDCSYSGGRHADITGDGIVWSADFEFIRGNFLKSGDETCTKAAGVMTTSASSAVSGGRTSIPVKELAQIIGMKDARKADVNNDGIVDTTDVQLFAQNMKNGK